MRGSLVVTLPSQVLFVGSVNGVCGVFPLGPSFIRVVHGLKACSLCRLVAQVQGFLYPNFVRFVIVRRFLTTISRGVVVGPYDQ